MKHAYLIEMTVIRDYARQLFALGIFVGLCTSLGMQSIVAIPGVLTCMHFIMGTIAGSAYDEQNNWALYRLTMPVSRRDVVLGRYGVIVTLGLLGMLAGFIATIALSLIAGAVPLPGDLSNSLGLTQDNVQAMVFSCAICTIIGSAVASIETPIYFRLGQTKATQWIPMISVFLFIGPMVILGATGGLDNFAGIADAVRGLFAFIETPIGVVTSMAVAIVVACIILGISAAVSLKLYEQREL